jgi:hypothetical protein
VEASQPPINHASVQEESGKATLALCTHCQESSHLPSLCPRKNHSAHSNLQVVLNKPGRQSGGAFFESASMKPSSSNISLPNWTPILAGTDSDASTPEDDLDQLDTSQTTSVPRFESPGQDLIRLLREPPSSQKSILDLVPLEEEVNNQPRDVSDYEQASDDSDKRRRAPQSFRRRSSPVVESDSEALDDGATPPGTFHGRMNRRSSSSDYRSTPNSRKQFLPVFHHTFPQPPQDGTPEPGCLSDFATETTRSNTVVMESDPPKELH